VLHVKVKASKAIVLPNDRVTYTLTIINWSPITQSFVVNNPIPKDTRYSSGLFYNRKANSIQWKGRVRPYGKEVLTFTVMVGSNTPEGVTITSQAVLQDSALGDTSSVSVQVK
jgi:uncharacterized repeat protein (TIGR01451 family)